MQTTFIPTRRIILISDDFQMRIIENIYTDAMDFYEKSLDEVEKFLNEEDLTNIVRDIHDYLYNSDVCFVLWEEDFLSEVQPIISTLIKE